MTTLPLRTGPGSGAVLDGRYRLMQRVGSGGMADVWSATDEMLERVVAVKLFRFDTSAADERRIRDEIRTVAALTHPGIVTVFDAGTMIDPESDGLALPYLVMEYVPGQTLASRLGSVGPLYDTEAKQVGAAIAGTLAYVHARGVVHRDIKPANLLLPQTPTGVPAKITDFGIARVIDSAHHTATGLTVGTPNYLAPEQATGADVGFAADVYALGLVLLECLTGSLAYPGTGVEAALARLHRDPVIPASLPAPWPELLAAMTTRDAAGRPDAAQVVAALDGASTPLPRVPLPSAAPAAVTARLLSDPLQETSPLPAAALADTALATDTASSIGTEPAAAAPVAGSRRHRTLALSVLGSVAAAGVVCGLLLSASGHGSGDADDAPGAGVQSTAAQMPVPAAVSNAPIGGPAQNPTTALTTHSTPATHSAAKRAPAKQAKQPSPEKGPPSGHDNGKHKGHGKGKAHP